MSGVPPAGETTDSRAISVAEMRAIEENCESLGVTRLLLMENAGREVAQETARHAKAPSSTVLVVAYNGNKAGDAFVAARHLSSKGFSVQILMIASPGEIKTEEARANWKIIQNLEKRIQVFQVQSSGEIKKFFSNISPSVVVDGLLGTGLRGDLREPLLTAVKEINNLRDSAVIVAIDVPSGLDPDTGVIHGEAIRAHVTVTHHRLKLGLIAKGANLFTGKVILVGVGIPREAELFTGPGDLRRALRPRSIYAHKGDSGRILVVAGSKQYSGSAILCSLAALRTGVDLVTVLAPDSIANVIQSYSPDLIVRSFPGEHFGPKAVSALREMLPSVNALAVGPGLGLAAETTKSVIDCLSLCKKLKIPIVVDADGVKALKGQPERIRDLHAVLTPHAGEFSILTGENLPPEKEGGLGARSTIVTRWAKRLRAIILVKGHEDIISDGVRTRLSRGGNPGMTVGGTGDVLTGLVVAFLASGNSGFEAACAGSYLNKAVGDYVASFKGYHMLASDLVETLPKILVRFDARTN